MDPTSFRFVFFIFIISKCLFSLWFQKFYLFIFKVQLSYSVVFVMHSKVIQLHIDVYLYMCTYILFFRLFSIIVYYKIFPELYSSLSILYIYIYIAICICLFQTLNLSLPLLPLITYVCLITNLSLFPMSLNLFLFCA